MIHKAKSPVAANQAGHQSRTALRLPSAARSVKLRRVKGDLSSNKREKPLEVHP
jgi:hypothetical protein